jgi:flagellar protein FliS
MSDSAARHYLRSAVMTASREKLQLMLYDGAIRFCQQARDAIVRKDIEGSYNLLTRAQNIVLEMQNALNPAVDPALCGRMSGLYSFIYRRLVEANIGKDLKALDDALQILQFQRETWVLLLEKLADGQAEPSSQGTGEPSRRSALSVQV